MARAIDRRPPMPGVAPTARPISTATSIRPMMCGEVSIATSELNMMSIMRVYRGNSGPLVGSGCVDVKHEAAAWAIGGAVAGLQNEVRQTRCHRRGPSRVLLDPEMVFPRCDGRRHGG